MSSELFIIDLEGEHLSTHNPIHHIEVKRKSDGLASDLFASEVKLGEDELLLLSEEVKDVKVEARSIA